jgi:hypothetical protein
MFPMFDEKDSIKKKQVPTLSGKKFLTIDFNTNYIWWQEEVSYLYISADQITEIKITPTDNNTFNIYVRIDLKDRFEYKFIDNRKTLASAKKLAEDFVGSFKKSQYITNENETIVIDRSKIVSFEVINSDLIITDVNGKSWKFEFSSEEEAKEEIKNIINNKPSIKKTKKSNVKKNIETDISEKPDDSKDVSVGLEPLALLMKTLKEQGE